MALAKGRTGRKSALKNHIIYSINSKKLGIGLNKGVPAWCVAFIAAVVPIRANLFRIRNDCN
ncbi:MAG: hypothetical protein FWF71_04560 [Actinomycetia bacterium]|nr:hypothetical protein [Actinomycetes bacterium]